MPPSMLVLWSLLIASASRLHCVAFLVPNPNTPAKLPFDATTPIASVLPDRHQECQDFAVDDGRRRAIRLAATTLQVFATGGVLLSDCGSTAWAAADNTGANPPLGLTAQLQQAESIELDAGLLESRVTENLLSPPSYGMEASDIFYPPWFQGTWRVASTTTDILAPCGMALFGGNATFDRARKEIGTTLDYEARFVVGSDGRVIADREFNVKSIAKAAMGEYSVLDIPLATPNKFTCILAPKGSPSMLKVDLLALNRRQETISELQFDCSEVTREIVAPVSTNAMASSQADAVPALSTNAPTLKEVETTSLYKYNPRTNTIQCRQRSATFLLPSQTSPIAMKMWEASRGRPVDVRFYNVQYQKVS